MSPVHAEFALSEADYFLGFCTRSRAGDAYDAGWWTCAMVLERRARDCARIARLGYQRGGQEADMTIWIAIRSPCCELGGAGGFVTTWVGIWLTTKRLLICWPVVLAGNLYLVVLYSRASLLRCAAAGVLWHHAIRLVALVARRGARRAKCAWFRSACGDGWWAGCGCDWRGAAWWADGRPGAALPHLDAALTSYSLVGSWWQARKHTATGGCGFAVMGCTSVSMRTRVCG